MTLSRPLINRRRTLTALPVVVALLAATACGSDDSNSSTDTTAAAATTATPDTSADTTAPADAEFWTATPPNMTPVDDATAAEWQELAELTLQIAEGTPGAIIAVSHPELGFWSTAIGDAEVDVDPMTLDHHSRIGSVTKTFTAVAVLRLVDAGELSLDDTVADVVPDVAEQFPETADITVEHLVSMTSGLPDYANVAGSATAQAVEDPTKVWAPEELIEAALDASEVEPIGTPGYSTTNFIILGLMYEAITGETIEAGIASVAEDAGLTDTALLPADENEMPDPSTHGYIDPAGVSTLADIGVEAEAGTETTDWSISWGGAGGGAYSTIEDLFLWASTGSGNTLLSTELGTQRLELAPIEGDELQYGLGILQQGVDGWYGHSGQAIGWEALAFYDPETGATFTVMINSTAGAQAFVVLWNELFDLGLDVPSFDEIEAALAAQSAGDGDGESAGDDTSGDEAGEASGSATLSVGDVTIDADIVACTLDPSEFAAQGETSQIILSLDPDVSGEANIVVSGGLQFEGSGSITVDDGQVTVVGSGAAPDDSAPVEDFTLEATIESC
ncbi:MAG: serine hydrolase domain-containing protein [Ilumatobacteraceae bacterium]